MAQLWRRVRPRFTNRSRSRIRIIAEAFDVDDDNLLAAVCGGVVIFLETAPSGAGFEGAEEV